MNSIAFLMMLAIFGGLAYWYVRNAEAGRGDGALGPLALKDDGDAGKSDETKPLTGAAAVKARVNAEDRGDGEGAKKDKIRPRTGLSEGAASEQPQKPQKQKAYRLKEDGQA